MPRIGIVKSSVCAAVGMALLVAGCSEGTPPAPPPPEVEIATIKAQPIATVIELPGRVQAIRTAEVRARDDGIVQRRLYKAGSDVRTGKALFGIATRELRATLTPIQATLAPAQANAPHPHQTVHRYSQPQ